MKIVLATRNRHKIKEFEGLLSRYAKGVELLSLDDVGITGEVEETADTFYDNAMLKARAAVGAGYIAVADDSGLMVAALGGAPGIHSARYAGAHGDDSANNALLLKNLTGVADRSAEFVCAIACAIPNSDGSGDFVVQGVVPGEILCEPRGEGGFGYDPLFWYEALGKTYAEMTPEEKNTVSHRAIAVEALAEKLNEFIRIRNILC